MQVPRAVCSEGQLPSGEGGLCRRGRLRWAELRQDKDLTTRPWPQGASQALRAKLRKREPWPLVKKMQKGVGLREKGAYICQGGTTLWGVT